MYVEVAIEILGSNKEPLKGFLLLDSIDEDLDTWQNGDSRLLVYVGDDDPEDYISLGADLGPRAVVTVMKITMEVADADA